MTVNEYCKPTVLSFILQDGTEVFPIKTNRTVDGGCCYRVSGGRRGATVLTTGEYVDEQTMVYRVLHDGCAVRCRSLNGAITGLYRNGQHAHGKLSF